MDEVVRLLHWSRASRRSFAAILNLVLLHLAVERRSVQSENLCRFLLVPVGPLERLKDRHSLDFSQRTVGRNDELCCRGVLRAQRLGKIE